MQISFASGSDVHCNWSKVKTDPKFSSLVPEGYVGKKQFDDDNASTWFYDLNKSSKIQGLNIRDYAELHTLDELKMPYLVSKNIEASESSLKALRDFDFLPGDIKALFARGLHKKKKIQRG
jgi:hypothetical protein